jgi:hypothetical protein
MELEMTLEDPKAYKKPIVMKIENVLEPDTALLEDFCDNERDSTKLSGGVRLGPEVLGKYAGAYEFAPGREVTISVSGELLIAQEAKGQRFVFVSRSETSFLSSTTNDGVQFFKDPQGNVTHLVWGGRGDKDEKAIRKK